MSSSTKTKIKQIDFFDTLYDLDVPKDLNENNPEAVGYVKGRTHWGTNTVVQSNWSVNSGSINVLNDASENRKDPVFVRLFDKQESKEYCFSLTKDTSKTFDVNDKQFTISFSFAPTANGDESEEEVFGTYNLTLTALSGLEDYLFDVEVITEAERISPIFLPYTNLTQKDDGQIVISDNLKIIEDITADGDFNSVGDINLDGGNININGGSLTINGESMADNIANSTKYTNNMPMINDIGGIKASEHPNGFTDVPLNDLITELLYPYTKPVINSFSLNPSAGVKEMNVPVTVNSATVKITKKSKPIQKVELYKDGTVVQTKTDDISSSGTTLTFTLNETLDGSTNTSYKVKVTDGSETVEYSAQTYSFVYPYFYGVVSDGATIDSATILGFTKSIRAKGSHGYTYTTNNQCPVIAYPKSYGALKSIIDPNNFTQTWTQNTVKVDNDGTIDGVDYYVYVGGASTATNTKYTFNY